MSFMFISFGPASPFVGFFSTWGYVIIVGTVLGFLIGIGEALAYGNIVIALISLLGLVSGLYIGSIGPKIEELENPPSYFTEFKSITDRLDRLERTEEPERGVEPEETEAAKKELAELEATYAKMKPSLGIDGEKVFSDKIREARRKVESSKSELEAKEPVQGSVEANPAKADLARLEADYARIKPYLSEQGEAVYRARLREARKAESDSSKPSE